MHGSSWFKSTCGALGNIGRQPAAASQAAAAAKFDQWLATVNDFPQACDAIQPRFQWDRRPRRRTTRPSASAAPTATSAVATRQPALRCLRRKPRSSSHRHRRGLPPAGGSRRSSRAGGRRWKAAQLDPARAAATLLTFSARQVAPADRDAAVMPPRSAVSPQAALLAGPASACCWKKNDDSASARTLLCVSASMAVPQHRYQATGRPGACKQLVVSTANSTMILRPTSTSLPTCQRHSCWSWQQVPLAVLCVKCRHDIDDRRHRQIYCGIGSILLLISPSKPHLSNAGE